MIFHIEKFPPQVGSRVKVWFDVKERHLLVEDEAGRVTHDIYGMPLADVVFETETTPRRAIRCVARGTIIAMVNSHAASEARQLIIREALGGMDFYWSRDKQWPFSRARLALISPPHGGFATSYAVDPVP